MEILKCRGIKGKNIRELLVSTGELTLARMRVEPGDATYYNYAVLACPGGVYFITDLNHDRTVKIKHYEVESVNDEDSLVELATKKNVNPWTLQEWINGIRWLKNDLVEEL